MINPRTLVALATFPDIEAARAISRALVEEKLVACANIIPQVESVYRWQGNIETAGETLVLFKTAAVRWDAFRDRLRALHPYEVPEIVRLDIADGLPAYLEWIAQSTDSAGES
jgi:periplasmic divalent cation tolerance protein